MPFWRGGYQPFPPLVVTTLPQIPSRGKAPFVSIGRRGSPMALWARPIRYIGSLLPTPSRGTTGRRPLTPRTTTQVWLFKQLLEKRTGALLVLPQSGLMIYDQASLKCNKTGHSLLILFSSSCLQLNQ